MKSQFFRDASIIIFGGGNYEKNYWNHGKYNTDFYRLCNQQAQAGSASIVIHVSEGTELQALIKTAHGNAVGRH